MFSRQSETSRQIKSLLPDTNWVKDLEPGRGHFWKKSQVESSKEIIYLMQLEVLPFLPAIVMKVFVSTYSIRRTLDL